MIKKILVPIDGSVQADKALYKAIVIAKENEAKLMILHVIERRPLIFGQYPYVDTPLNWLKGYPGYIYPDSYPDWTIEYGENIQKYSSDYFTKVIEQLKWKKEIKSIYHTE